MALSDRIEVTDYKMVVEPRGWFQKPLTGSDLIDDGASHQGFGEIYAVQALKGESRGNHYHERAIEWFFVLSGAAKVLLFDMDTREFRELSLDALTPKRLLIRPRIAHAFVNESDDPLLLVAYTDMLFNPADTIACDVAQLIATESLDE